MGAHVVELTDDNFESEVLAATGPILVDFWAPWCGPCRAIAPMIDQLATENMGSAKVGKLNIDDSPRTAERFQVASIPTLLIFKSGEVVNQWVGAPAKSKLQDALNSAK